MLSLEKGLKILSPTLIVLLVCSAIDHFAGIERCEVEPVLRGFRVKCGPDAFDAWVADWSWRKALEFAGIIRRVTLEVGGGDFAVVA